MNNRILSQKKAAWMKYRCKIRRYTEPYQRKFARDRLLMDYLRIDGKCCTNYADHRRIGKRRYAHETTSKD